MDIYKECMRSIAHAYAVHHGMKYWSMVQTYTGVWSLI
jgi:hypothetical protein